MRIFVAASYSSKVDYKTGEVFASYKDWLEDILTTLEKQNHTVFCALREDWYRINNSDPAAAFRLDVENIEKSDALLALLDSSVSTGVQTEIGIAIALKKKVLLAHASQDGLSYFNSATIKAGAAIEIKLPLTDTEIQKITT